MLRLLALFAFVVVTGAKREDGVVRFAEGRVRGSTMVSFSGREFHAFRGIPYAEPPTGNRRFRPPQPKAPWRGIQNVTTEGPLCPQMDLGSETFVGDEDCLYLNIFAPKNAKRYPVIVWVHGGGFIEGNGGIRITGPQYLMDHNLVFVTFNYRLGPLGFLSTGDSALPGNYGLKDGVEVLRWVRRNIEAFGGNPELVTLFGYSSGAANTQSMTMSPLTKGLFHRVVFESGSALHHWAFKPTPIQESRQVAQLIGCPSTESSSEIAKCVKAASAKDLVETLYSFPYWSVKYPLPYGLVVETQDDDSDPPFLTEPPKELFRKGRIHKVPALTGDTNAESIVVPYMAKIRGLLKDLDERFGEIVLKGFIPGNITDEIVREVKEFYFGNKTAENVPFQVLLELFSDTTYYYNTYQSISAYASATDMPVYTYLFSFQGRLDSVVIYLNATSSIGVNHADDLFYIIGREVDFPGGGPNAEETKTLQRVTKMLANFALTGDPTPETSDLLPVKWLPMCKGNKPFPYLSIDKELAMKHGPFYSKRITFWNNLFAKIGRHDL